MTGLGMLLLSVLLWVFAYSSSALDLDLDEYYSNLQNVDLQEPFPDDTCSIGDKSCVMHDNVIEIIPEIFTLEECRDRCERLPECAFLTYFDEDNFPFGDTCVLLSKCDDIAPCNDCKTEDMKSECVPCSGRVHGAMGANYIGFTPNMAEESDCKRECKDQANCAWYTYYDIDDPTYPGGCFLLSDVQEPFQSCSNCQTGPMECAKRCMFSVDGGEFKNTIDPVTGNATVKARTFGHCELTVVAVGGGAQGFTGGGGSGYVEYENISGAGMKVFDVMVGESGEDTVLFYDDTIFLEAKSGEQPPVNNREAGGNGYSGGGAAVFMSSVGGGDGGTGGGDGVDSSNGNSGGKGSGLDLADIPIDGLSAGAGGKANAGVGGGGGGILIDGQGPNSDGRNGQGYGAGGYGNGLDGNAGVVLFSYHKK